ncbi:Kinesin-like protein kif24 [Actinomortierella wolfii]|nr:Kinesin-like protein kif24 [Actinomortierella wolfii]
MSTSLLLEMLRRAQLEHFYPSFSTRGITQLDNLVQLSMQDYNSLGVTSMEDRRRLFQLIQTIKSEYPDICGISSTTPGSSSLSSHSPGSSVSHTTSIGTGHGMSVDSNLSNAGYGMAGIPRGYSTQPTSDTSVRSSDARLSMGRRAGTAVAHTLNNSANMGHTRTMSNSIPQHQQQHYSQQIQYQQQQQEQQRLQLQQQQQQHSDLRNFKEVSDDEEELIPIHESRQRSLDAYSIPTGMNRSHNKGGVARNTGAEYLPSELTAKIRVCVRKRPLNSKEISKGEKDMAHVTGRQLAVDEPKVRVDMTKYIERHNFVFDEVFDSDATNEDVYRRTALPLVQYLFEGGKATCFAYGQTGSGKTYTMLDEKQGLYVLAARDIFALLKKPEYQHLAAHIGFYEIYQGHLYDLLNRRKRLHAREDGKNNVVINGLKEYEIQNVQGLMQVFEYGNNARSTGSTNANADSSRSHAIMQVVLRDRRTKSVEGKLSFIDLAGSERGADRGETDAKTRLEGAEINKSLLALKECIRALDQDKKHTPFRQSKLTQVLKDSFVGNSRTCMVATISPNNSNSEHTLNTLRYADRVKELKADGGGRPLLQGQDVAQDEFMDEEAYDNDDLANVGDGYDDASLSSDGENYGDVTIDLLEDEEFPDVLDREEMVHHALAANTYEHELEDTTMRRASLQAQQQAQYQQQQHTVKARKSEVFSRLPMPRSLQQGQSGVPQPQQQQQLAQAGGSGTSPTLAYAHVNGPSRRYSFSSIGRSNSTNNASSAAVPGGLSGARRSPDSTTAGNDESMSPASSPALAHPQLQSTGVNNSNITNNKASRHPSINTKHGHSGSMSSAPNSAGVANLAQNGEPTAAQPGFYAHGYHLGEVTQSPTSPKIATGERMGGIPGRNSISSTTSSASVSTVPAPNAPLASSSGTGGASMNWTPAEMDEFVREHRKQMRDLGEWAKRETKLLATVTLGMSSAAHAQHSGFANSRESFLFYLNELDAILDDKLISIVDLSRRIKALRQQT